MTPGVGGRGSGSTMTGSSNGLRHDLGFGFQSLDDRFRLDRFRQGLEDFDNRLSFHNWLRQRVRLYRVRQRLGTFQLGFRFRLCQNFRRWRRSDDGLRLWFGFDDGRWWWRYRFRPNLWLGLRFLVWARVEGPQAAFPQ